MFSTVSLGGLSSHDASFGHWNSLAIEVVAMVFLMLAGVSFALYFIALRTRSLRVLWADQELRAYFGVVFGSVVLVSVYLAAHGKHASYLESLRHAAFHVISVATTGGYAISDYGQWPPFAPVLMIGLGCFATCAGSTGGGIKMIRVLLLLKQSQRELVRIVHPNVVNPVVLGDAVVPPQVLQSVLAYMDRMPRPSLDIAACQRPGAHDGNRSGVDLRKRPEEGQGAAGVIHLFQADHLRPGSLAIPAASHVEAQCDIAPGRQQPARSHDDPIVLVPSEAVEKDESGSPFHLL